MTKISASEKLQGDIILLDSDSETSESSSHPLKKHKPNGDTNTLGSFKKPYMNNTSSSSSPSGSGTPGSGTSSSSSPSPPQEVASNHRAHENPRDFNLSSSTSISESEGDNNEGLVINHDGGASSSSYDYSSDSSVLQQISTRDHTTLNDAPSNEDDSDNNNLNNTEQSRKTISDTRKFLKEHGTVAFLENYLPTTATSSDLLNLIINLGFLPKNLPSFDDEKIIGLIKLLHAAMKKVRLMRSRIHDFYNIDHVLSKIKLANKILVITGAGISTSLGIPDFRSSKGFYSKLESLGLSDPQEVFDLELFHTDPSIFYSIAFMILPPENIYSPLHSFIKLLQSKQKLLRNYTQNIDNLESYAGIHPDKLIQCHGSFAFATCVTCQYKVKGEKIFPAIRNKEIAYCPKCNSTRLKLLKNDEVSYLPESYGVMKPDITFFGEALPRKFHDSIKKDLLDCDLIISIGTSLKVSPVADIIERVPPKIPQVLINRDPIDHCNFDVSLLGYCDDVASHLCQKLGPKWNIPHPKYSSILGPDGSNLRVDVVDINEGVFKIVNKTTEAEQEAENAKREESLIHNENGVADEVVEID